MCVFFFANVSLIWHFWCARRDRVCSSDPNPVMIIQGDGRKFMGHFINDFWAINIIRITQTGSYLANEGNICNKSNLGYSLYTIDCCADSNTPEACTVTQKLDLDQMS